MQPTPDRVAKSTGRPAFTPGQPVDERRPSDLARAQASYFGDVEFKVARVVARLTGARVVLQDDGSQDAMPDLRIEDQSCVVACGEIWVDTGRPDDVGAFPAPTSPPRRAAGARTGTRMAGFGLKGDEAEACKEAPGFSS